MNTKLFVLVCVVVTEAKEFGGGWGGGSGWGGSLGKGLEGLKLLKGLKEMGGGWGSSGLGWGGGWGRPGLSGLGGSGLGLISQALNNGWSGGRGSMYFTHRPLGAYPILGGTRQVNVPSLQFFRNMAQNSHDYHNHRLTSQAPVYTGPPSYPSAPSYQPSASYQPSSPPYSPAPRSPVTTSYSQAPSAAPQYSPPQAAPLSPGVIPPPVYSGYESSAPASSPYGASSNMIHTTFEQPSHVTFPENSPMPPLNPQLFPEM